jgi:hypothetical protein
MFCVNSIDGKVLIMDARTGKTVRSLVPTAGTPPWAWSSCWSCDGDRIFSGRRNGTGILSLSLSRPPPDYLTSCVFCAV